MAPPLLSPSMICNTALVIAANRAKVNACHVSNRSRIEDNFADRWVFMFWPKQYIETRKLQSNYDARAYDDDLPANGLVFSIRINENLPALHPKIMHDLIAKEVDFAIYGLAALRVAG